MISRLPLRVFIALLIGGALLATAACSSKKADDTAGTDTAMSADSVTAEATDDATPAEADNQEEAAEEEDVTGQKGLVSTKENSDLRIRALPDIESGVLGKIPNKTTVEIVGQDVKTTTLNGEKGRWLKVKYNNIEGWVWGNFIVLE